MGIPFSEYLKAKTSKIDDIAVRHRGLVDGLELSREELLTLQFTKLLNYFPTQLDVDWGGGFFLQGDYRMPQQGLASFLEKMQAGSKNLPLWIERKYPTLPWSAANTRLTDNPPPYMGDPYEAYLTCNGGIMTLKQASRFLRLDSKMLLVVKLRLLIDEAVIADSISRSLKPGIANWDNPDAE